MDTTNNHGQVFDHTMQISDEDILNIFDEIDLAELPLRAGNGDAAKGLNVIKDWGKILSLGEQQRLAFGRILVNRPSFVILDEATSAMDTEAESKMYSLLNQTGRKITYISVGHRQTLLKFHVSKLSLRGTKGHSFEEIIHDFKTDERSGTM